MSADKYKNLKVKELQDLLQKNGLSHSGKKEELIERLVKHDEQNQEFASLEEEFGDLDEFDESKVNLDELGDKPIDDLTSLDQLSTEQPSSNTTTATTTKDEKNSDFQFTPVTFDKPATTKSKETATMSDAERALERAKRFGIQLNETAKKDIRAQRFGVAQSKPSQDADRLKKRAERFGITKTQANVAKLDPVEEEKKRKRAERFNVNKKSKVD
ncbi:hypothetical protein BD560DRAFT_390693 [Blakeslea trispora]|nr:hypothetical protein BD560DRAFT_390693 [Blakeslea trispora]